MSEHELTEAEREAMREFEDFAEHEIPEEWDGSTDIQLDAEGFAREA